MKWPRSLRMMSCAENDLQLQCICKQEDCLRSQTKCNINVWLYTIYTWCMWLSVSNCLTESKQFNIGLGWLIITKKYLENEWREHALSQRIPRILLGLLATPKVRRRQDILEFLKVHNPVLSDSKERMNEVCLHVRILCVPKSNKTWRLIITA